MRVLIDVETLHKKSTYLEFTQDNDKHRKAVERKMLDTYHKTYNREMQGLAAIQLGIVEPCVLIRYSKEEELNPKILWNPKVIFSLGFKLSVEGCMSEPEGRYVVWRPMLCYISYNDVDGALHKEWLPYKKARIFCHECDHTNGIILKDKGIRVQGYDIHNGVSKHK